jgi:lysophospholipase L1-like esterase
LRAVISFAASLALLAGAAAFFDRVLIPRLELEGKVAALSWKNERARLIAVFQAKNRATEAAPLWRSAGIDVNERKRAHRILVIGDSFVWGYGTANVNDLWWRQLERELQRRGLDVEVVAAGYSGWTTAQELAAAPAVIAETKPDLVIWGYVTNDSDENVVKQFVPQPDQLGRVTKRLRRFAPDLAGLIDERWARKAEHQHASDAAGYPYDVWELKILEGKNFERYQQTVGRLAAFTRSLSIPSLMVTLPNYPSTARFRPRYEKVLRLFRSAGLDVYDMLPAFVAAFGDFPEKGGESVRWGVNPADAHPGRRATHFYAAQVADLLVSQHPEAVGKPVALAPTLEVNDWTPSDLVRSRRGLSLELAWPRDNEQLMVMPLRRPFAQLNLAQPLRLAAVRISGPALRRATLDLVSDGATPADEQVDRTLGERAGSSIEFVFPKDLVTQPVDAIRIGAELGSRNELTVELVPAAGGA